MTSTEGMGEATADSGKKAIAFLKKPQGLILLALAVGAGYLWWTRGTNAQQVTDPNEQTPVGGYTDNREPPGSATGGVVNTVTTPQDNAEWLAAGVLYMTAQFYDPLLAQNALTKYLGGEPVSAKEKEIISKVLGKLGSPPNGAPSIVDEPPPPNNPPPTNNPPPSTPAKYPGNPRPTSNVAYVTKRGDTWTTVLNSRPYRATTNVAALKAWNSTHSVVAGGKRSNPLASGYATFGTGTVLALPNISPGVL